MVNLGDEVKDTVSGFKGIAIGVTQFLNGCRRIGLQPPVAKDGQMKPAEWFDEPQLEVIKAGKVSTVQRVTGGPMPSTPTRNMPR